MPKGKWTQARFATQASPAAKIVCCGNPNCFDGSGCETARWWTRRMAEKGYELTPYATLEAPDGP